eukprot:3329969-Lingulodinium_polyedra.AAC.1
MRGRTRRRRRARADTVCITVHAPSGTPSASMSTHVWRRWAWTLTQTKKQIAEWTMKRTE